MTKLYDQLKEDHRNLVKVLDVLKRQIALYDTREEEGAEKPDSALILDIMDYIQHYPDRFHHPLEEACFDYLDEQNRGDAAARDAIRAEHKELEHSSSKVRTRLNAINLGEAVPLDKLHQTLDQFHTLQLDHLKREEKTVFRDIKALDDAASAIILDRVEHRHDPLFAEVANQQFNELIRQLKYD
ncbi:MAG: hemerythrin domain-containing protein [Saccharospirillum sp.]|uniref:hemerythrin domain-containing protein n=1 Tax=Saccharospirillum sp. TaxID=2033801 RepID=UPI003299DB01